MRVTTPAQAIASAEVTELEVVTEAIGGEYEILEELGRGGMAIVYRARERQLDREVAIKVLPFSLAFDAEFVERFQREARTAAQLEHPNIIPIYRVGRIGRVIFFVMKFLRGSALSRTIAERPRLPPAEIKRLLTEVGNALGYAAKRGIVHRDIKPDNIMFDEFGQCVVADFGIAKAASGQKLTGTGMSIGTPHYMSPEQARAQAIDGRSDIYSLGVVAYQCLTGQVPFDGEDSFAIGYKHIMDPVPIPTLASAEERRLFEVIRKMLMKDPAERFQDADELIRALEGQPMTASAPRISTAAGSGPRRASLSMQPTAPIPGLATSSGPHTPTTDSARRSVVRRSPANQPSNRGWLVPVIILLGLLGAWMIFHNRSSAVNPKPVPPAPDTSTSSISPSETDSARLQDSLLAAGAGTVAPAPADTHHVPAALPASHPASTDSGSLRVMGLPPGSTVMVDEQRMTQATIRLSSGAHVLAITAPNHEFFMDTVVVRTDEVQQVTPALVPVGQSAQTANVPAARNCEVPGPLNRFGRDCYDAPPRPTSPTRLALPADITVTPSPSIFVVKVSADGHTLNAIARTPSSDPEFQRLAAAYVQTMEWTPATKGGAAVAGWIQLVIQPL
ncbi:MAG TPA: protein kinase [Gemmatimonadales bacterium]|nr:protein kinase [Gemmatimonadales bacterium]